MEVALDLTDEWTIWDIPSEKVAARHGRSNAVEFHQLGRKFSSYFRLVDANLLIHIPE